MIELDKSFNDFESFLLNNPEDSMGFLKRNIWLSKRFYKRFRKLIFYRLQQKSQHYSK